MTMKGSTTVEILLSDISSSFHADGSGFSKGDQSTGKLDSYHPGLEGVGVHVLRENSFQMGYKAHSTVSFCIIRSCYLPLPFTLSFLLLLSMLQSQEIARDVFPKLYYQ